MAKTHEYQSPTIRNEDDYKRIVSKLTAQIESGDGSLETLLLLFNIEIRQLLATDTDIEVNQGKAYERKLILNSRQKLFEFCLEKYRKPLLDSGELASQASFTSAGVEMRKAKGWLHLSSLIL